MNKPTDYHDYVFRGGKLVAEFEEMYRNSATIPRHQDEQEHWIDVRLTKEFLQDISRFEEIHNFGCVTGHYLDLMVKHSLATNEKSFGYDVSATACEKVTSLFPAQQLLCFRSHSTNNLRGFHDPRHALVCVSKAGHRHREHCQSNA